MPAANSRPSAGRAWWIDDGDPHGWTRRQFMQRSALAGVSLATASLWHRVLEGTANAAAGAAGLPDVEEFLGRDQVAELLRIGLSRGGEFAEVYGEYTVDTNFTIDERQLKTAQYGILQGVGIRVIVGDQVGYAYADEFGMEALRQAARVAAEIASRGNAGAPKPFAVSKAKPPFVLTHPAALATTEEARIEVARKADAAARAHDPRIRQVIAVRSDAAKSILVANSDGLWATDRQFIARLSVGPTAIDGTNRQRVFANSGGQVEADYFERVSTPESLARDAAAGSIALLGAVEPRAGTYPVVIGPGWGGVLVHECFGHSLEGDGIRKKTSLRAFQLDQKVCSEIVDIYDDSTIPYSRGSFRVDDEGTPSQKSHVVEKGILRGYLWDRLNGGLTGHASTANGRRNSYRDFPIPRMTNTYIDAGPDDPATLIGSVKKGLYCKRLGGGSVNPADGAFSFVVQEAYEIENGKLGACVKGATLTGNAAEAMLRVDGLGNDLEIDGTRGNCGKDGQWKPVGVGQPTVRFSEMTVGGTAA
jgi:TldD protein